MAVDADGFWDLLDSARAEAGAGADGERVVQAVTALLSRRPVPEIVASAQVFWDLMAASYRADLWAAAYEINGGCSDDGFEYFRGWLLTQGRGWFERVVADPDELAKHPVVRAAAASGGDLECEDMLGVAWDAHLAATGQELPQGAFTIRYPAVDFDWDIEDKDERRRRLPRLGRLYDED